MPIPYALPYPLWGAPPPPGGGTGGSGSGGVYGDFEAGGSAIPGPDPVQSITTPPGGGSLPYEDYTDRPDIALDGRPLWLAISPENPVIRKMAPYRKEQVDQTPEPGEQSLQTWWARAQSSFHSGSGQVNLDGSDVTNDAVRSTRYLRSVGLNPWRQGRMTLLKDTTLLQVASGASQMVTAYAGSQDYMLYSSTNVLSSLIEGASPVAITWGGATDVKSLATSGTHYYAASVTNLYKGALPSGAGASIYTWAAPATNVVVRYVKQRIIAAVDNNIYELPPAGGALPAALYSHPNPSWIWTDICEGPKGIYASGYAGDTSAVYKFIVNPTTLVLVPGGVSAAMPRGEIAHSLLSYLNSFVALGTSTGVRVCKFSGFGGDGDDLLLGPLSVKSDVPITSLAGVDRFVYAGARFVTEDGAGLWRIDLGSELGNGSQIYASCTDLRANDYSAPVAGGAGAVEIDDSFVPDEVSLNGDTTDTGGAVWDRFLTTGTDWYTETGGAYPSVVSSYPVFVESGSADGVVSSVPSPKPGAGYRSSNDCGISFRCRGTTTELEYWRWTGVNVQKVIWPSTTTASITTSAAAAYGDTMSVEMSGNNLTFKINGTTVGTVTDSWNATETKHGLAGWDNSGSSYWSYSSLTAATPAVDDFRVGAVDAIGIYAGRVCFTVRDAGLFLEHSTRLVSSGYLTTSQIRYRTNDPKLFKRLRVLAAGTGDIIVRLSVDTGTEYQVGVVSPATDRNPEISLSSNTTGAIAQMSFTLVRDATSDILGPELDGYTLKSLPAQPRQRIYILPVRVGDTFADTSGQTIGSEGMGASTLTFIESLNAVGEEVLLEWIGVTPAARASVLVVVDDYEYRQVSPNTATQSVSGIATVTLRTLG